MGTPHGPEQRCHLRAAPGRGFEQIGPRRLRPRRAAATRALAPKLRALRGNYLRVVTGWGSSGGADRVVPFGVEAIAGEGHGGELGGGDLDAGRVVAVVSFGVDLERDTPKWGQLRGAFPGRFRDVTADHERGRNTGGSSFEVDVETGETGWIEMHLDASTDERGGDGVTVPLEADRPGFRDFAVRAQRNASARRAASGCRGDPPACHRPSGRCFVSMHA